MHPTQLQIMHLVKLLLSVALVLVLLVVPVVNADYKVLSVTQQPYGWEGILQLSTPGPYGNDIEYASLTVFFETEYRLRVTIRDANNVRWEVPATEIWNVTSAPPKAAPPSMLYKFSYEEAPFSFAVTRISTGEVLFNTAGSDFVFSDIYLELTTQLPKNANMYGLGERITSLRLPQDTFTIWNMDWGNPTLKNLYGHHPLYLRMEDSGNAHIVQLVNSNMMDVTLGNSSLNYKVIGGIFDFYFYLGPTPLNTIRQYTELIGKPFMPPRYSVGWHQCRWGYNTANYTLEVVKNYTANGLPLDTIWNDIDWMENYFAFTYAGEYDGNRFDVADMNAFRQYLKENNKHYVVINDCNVPAVLQDSNGEPYLPYTKGMEENVFVMHPARDLPLYGKQWPSVPVAWPDWTNPATENWLFEMFQYWNMDVEVPDGIWNDMNEVSAACSGQLTSACWTPGHPDPNSQLRILDPKAVPHPQVNLPTDLPYPPYQPGKSIETIEQVSFNISSWLHFGRSYDVKDLWGSLEARAYFRTLQKLKKKRGFVLTRSSFMGTGNHAAHWTGDNYSTWPSLQSSIASIIAMGIYGIPMVGSDICGFEGNTTPSLCARWIQLGALYPFSRSHDAIGATFQEPYLFPDPYLSMMRNAINLRYSLLTHIYSLYVHTHFTGEPVWRALFMEFPMDSLTYGIDQQVMLGGELLIIPVIDSETSVNVTGYVPNDDWFDYYTSARVAYSNGNSKNGKNMTFTSEYDIFSHVPLLLRGGHIVPSQTPQLNSFETVSTPLVLHTALNSQGQAIGDAYFDDGETVNAHELGLYNHLFFNASLRYDKSSNLVQGTYTYTLANFYANYSISDLSIFSIIVMGLDLPSTFDPTAQPVYVVFGSSGNPIPLKQDVSTLNGALVLSQSIAPFLPVAESFVLYFGSAPSTHRVVSF